MLYLPNANMEIREGIFQSWKGIPILKSDDSMQEAKSLALKI